MVLLFLSPWLIGFFVFTLYPVLASLYYSFTHYDLLSTPRWIGTANYTFMFTKDPFFWTAVRNTAWIILWGVPLRIIVAVATASLLVRPRRGVTVYRTMFFLPTLAPAVAAALAFVFLFNPAIGPINQILSGLGMEEHAAVVPEPDLVEARDLDHRAVGDRRRDGDLPRGAARRAASALRGRRHRRGLAASSGGGT